MAASARSLCLFAVIGDASVREHVPSLPEGLGAHPAMEVQVPAFSVVVDILPFSARLAL